MKTLFGSYRQGDKFEETAAINSWEKVVGTIISQNDKKVVINKKNLYLKLGSQALRSEIRDKKLVLIEKVNKYAGKEIIRDINC